MDKNTNKDLELIINDYDSFPSFIAKYKKLSIIEFNYYSVNDLSLFFVHDNYDFDIVEGILVKIENTLSAIKRIFAKPIIHLKEQDEVLPVENVRLINNATINHIATHSELWADYNKNGIKPLKLLTRTYHDDYSIYENILFAKTVDCILDFLHKNMRELENLMNSCRIIELNLLERTNHWDYFLALGKLQIGYVRDFGKHFIEAKNLYDRMSLVYDALTARLKRNVYRLNHKKTKGLELHNSNILHMDKDYHKVYVLFKKYLRNYSIDLENQIIDKALFYNNYFAFLKILFIFSIQHFNFSCDESIRFSLEKMDISFEFSDWNLHLESNDKAIILTITKDKPYVIAVVPVIYKNTKFTADEIVYVSPILGERRCQYISINDIESFRRIQRILQRGMIYSDLTFDTCLFCGDSLKDISLDEDEKKYVCNSCRMYIVEKKCKVTKENYYLTSIYNYNDKEKNNVEVYNDPSALYHYRNITDVSEKGQFICPRCRRYH